MTAVSTITIIKAEPGSASAVEQVLGDLSRVARTATGDPRYTSQRGLEDPDVFVTIERWDSEETVVSHLSHPTLGDVLESTEHLLAAPPQVIYLRPCDPAGSADLGSSSAAGERVRVPTS